MHAQCATVALGQDREISPGLRCLHDSECVFLLRHGKISRVVAGDRQENSAVGTALVGLTGRVQKTGPEPEASGDAFFVANACAQGLQQGLMLRVHFDVGEHGKVIARM